jgi:hypothetical protein
LGKLLGRAYGGENQDHRAQGIADEESMIAEADDQILGERTNVVSLGRFRIRGERLGSI